jgi:hypothetical protein
MRFSLPHPHLVILRSAATVVLSALVAQAGWAAAFLGGEPGYLRHHRVGAVVTLAVCVATAVIYILLRRSAGPVNVVLAILVAALAGIQYGLAEAAVVGAHVFLGVLLAMTGTALTSWTYRHSLPAPA